MYNIYIPNAENITTIFGANSPICMDAPALRAYAKEHDLLPELLRFQFRIATKEDIVRWGSVTEGMKPEDFQAVWIATHDATSKDVYIADAGMAYVWGDIDGDAPIPDERIEFLEKMWDSAHMTLNGFAAAAHMSFWDLCRIMVIYRQTALDWRADAKSIPDYVRIMMARGINFIPTIANNGFASYLAPAVFRCFWINAMESNRKDHYVGDNGMHHIWPDSDDNLDMRVAYLERIWDAAYIDMDAFASAAGMSLADLCRTIVAHISENINHIQLAYSIRCLMTYEGQKNLSLRNVCTKCVRFCINFIM